LKKIFFDEDVPRKLVRFLPQYDIQTVVTMQWGGIKNGALLQLIEQHRFDVFLTGDKNMPNQQQLVGRPFAVLIMSAINWPLVKPHLAKIVTAIDAATPGSVHTIECGTFTRKR
jgi:predicted nuclease of predicted toxin-antitoxin system